MPTLKSTSITEQSRHNPRPHTLRHATRAPNEIRGSMTLNARDGDGMSGMRASAGYMGTMASGARIPMSCALKATERQRLPPAESPARHTVSAVLPVRGNKWPSHFTNRQMREKIHAVADDASKLITSTRQKKTYLICVHCVKPTRTHGSIHGVPAGMETRAQESSRSTRSVPEARTPC